MGFFDIPDPPDAEEEDDVDDDDPNFGLQPSPWLPGIVALDLMLAQVDEAAVWLTRIASFPDGVEFTLRSFLRPRDPREHRRRLGRLMRSRDFAEPSEPAPDEFLRFGVAWPDGATATNLEGWDRNWDREAEPDRGLEAQGGGGDDQSYEQGFWLWPLPLEGDLTFVVEWPAYEIEETSTVLNAGVLAEAATRARPVWSTDIDKPSHTNRAALFRSIKEREEKGGSGGLFVEL